MGLLGTSFEPPLTEKNLPSQKGKVFIVTGASSGVGKELANILYSHDAKVYMAARSSEKASSAIQSIKASNPNSKGELIFLKLDLDDLHTIKASAQESLNKETRLDVLWNNAGVMIPPQGNRTKQNYELQLGTNNIAPFHFTKLLAPVMSTTANGASTGSVRVVWVASSAAANFAPPGGVDMSNLDYKTEKSAWHKYGVSKAGNILHSLEFAKRYRNNGIMSLALDPGNLKTDLYKSMPRFQRLIVNLILKDPIFGAYTELFADLSAEIKPEMTGAWIEPTCKIGKLREDIATSSRSTVEGGSGVGEQFWMWCESQDQGYY